MPTQPEIQILRVRAVMAMTGISKNSIYRQMDAGDFPQAIRLGPRAVGWRKAEVEEWLAGRYLARETEAA